jgi:hypothetical protein
MNMYLDIDEAIAADLLKTQETGISQSIEGAGDYLSNAVVLWKMIDPDRAARLECMLNEELQYSPNQAILRLRREQVERLVEHLRGIETAAIGTIMDRDYHALPDKVDYVNENAPGLLLHTTDAQGASVHVLDKITEIEWLRSFLETALRLGVDVIRD